MSHAVGSSAEARRSARPRLGLYLALAGTFVLGIVAALESPFSHAVVGNCGNVINGTSGHDVPLNGEEDKSDDISGRAGNDTINGKGKGDCLHGGADADTVYGKEGDDQIDGGDGADVLSGGTDVFGQDELFGDGGMDTLYGYAADDQLDGGESDDDIYGGDGNDRLHGGTTGADDLFGENGEDFLDGGSNLDNLNGGADNDVIYAIGGATDTVDCGSGTTDTAMVDAGIDSVTNCEVVVNPPPLPAPPNDDYTDSLPGGAVSVSTGSGLATALSSATAQDIILENGTYSGTTYFSAAAPHRLWARNLGGATLTAGIVFGGSGSGGGEVHGLAFNVSNRTYTYGDASTTEAMVFAYGDRGAGTKVYDTTFDGNGAIDAGIFMRRVEGAVIQRVTVDDVRRWGIYVDDFQASDPDHFDNAAQISTITDIDVENVREVTPGSSGGTAEAGLWIGNRVTNAVQRLRLEHAFWTGLWTGDSSKLTTFEDITVTSTDNDDEPSRGIYPEHRSDDNVYRRFLIGPDIDIGINCEWHRGHTQPRGACDGSVFQDGILHTREIGVYLGDESVNNVVTDNFFMNQNCTGIYNGPPGTNNTTTPNDFTGVDLFADEVSSSLC